MQPKLRPIAIACFEDKLVDWVVGKILSNVYEPLFIKNSFGHRPNKSAHNAIEACYYSICKNQRKHVVEIDFANFFDRINQDRLVEKLSKIIEDKRILRIIGKTLRSGVMQEGLITPTIKEQIKDHL